MLSCLVAGCASSESPASPTIAPSLACAGYGPEAASPYRLPYPFGTSYLVEQANCSFGGHNPGWVFKYGYDFRMAIGTPVHAARAGRVLDTEDRYPDANRVPFEENYVFVEHADGTVARYFHLTQFGVRVERGASVEAGDLLGLSGDTGQSLSPHLHFDVIASPCPARDCVTIPVTFNNTRPHPGGLVEGEVYRAGGS